MPNLIKIGSLGTKDLPLNGSKLGGKFFGPVKTRNLQFAFWTLRKNFRQNGQNEGRF